MPDKRDEGLLRSVKTDHDRDQPGTKQRLKTDKEEMKAMK
jgi:hypothetical protein